MTAKPQRIQPQRQRWPGEKCIEIARCPLYVASHDGRLAGFGCVDDMVEPCRVARGQESYEGALSALIAEAFRVAHGSVFSLANPSEGAE